MSNQQNPAIAALWGGYQSDEDKSLSAGSGSAIKFGLNSEVQITQFLYSNLTGVGGAIGNPALCITFLINGTEVNTRIYNPGQKVYFKGKEITDVNSPDYMEGLMQQVRVTKGMITHYLKAFGIQEAQLQASLASIAPGFEPLATFAQQVVAPLLISTRLDLFAHYQASIKSGQKITYLEIPGDLTYGSFLTQSTPGTTWEEVDNFVVTGKDGSQIAKKGLAYVNTANPAHYHRFVRDETFLKSKRATQQNVDNMAQGIGVGGGASPFAKTSALPLPSPGDVKSWGA